MLLCGRAYIHVEHSYRQWSKHPWSEVLLCGRAYIHVEHSYRPVV